MCAINGVNNTDCFTGVVLTYSLTATTQFSQIVNFYAQVEQVSPVCFLPLPASLLCS